jgi:hypothetical protein
MLGFYEDTGLSGTDFLLPSMRADIQILASYKRTRGTMMVSGATIGSETGVTISANAKRAK